jgi:hypothetical protein
MATKKRPFDIGDEVCLKGTVRLLDLAGPGSVTVEIHATATAQRITVSETARGIELIAKAPKGRRE